jgi:hypothetical protein
VLFERLRDQLRQQVLEEQSARLMETARAAAEMEIAAWYREQEQQLYEAAVRYLGKRGTVMASVCGGTARGRQMLIELAQRERATAAPTASPGRHALVDGGRRGVQQRQLAAPTPRQSFAEHWTPGQPLTQAALVAAHGPECVCTTCALAPWRRGAVS